MNITFVSRNKEKIKYFKSAFKDFAKIVSKKIELPEIQSENQKKILLYKARHAFKLTKSPVLVDDTAFYINSYKNFPGTLTKYINSMLGIKGFMKLYEEGDQGHFLTMLCYKDKTCEIVTKGVSTGTITKKISKDLNSCTPLNSIFIPEGFYKPISELRNDLKLKNIHRDKAFIQLIKKIKAR